MAEETQTLGREEYQWLQTLAFVFLQQSMFDKALSILEFLDLMGGEAGSQDPTVLKKLAYVYLHTEQFERALGACQRFLKQFPEEKGLAYIHLIHAQALVHLGRKEEAKESAELYLAAR